MKAPLAIIFLLISISVFAQSTLLRIPVKPVACKTTASNLKDAPTLESINKKIRVGRDLTISGTTLVVTAPAFMLTGLAFQFGLAYRQQENKALSDATIAIFALGCANFVAGVPMLTVGAVKWRRGKKEKRNFSSPTSQLQAFVTPGGQMGLALKF